MQTSVLSAQASSISRSNSSEVYDSCEGAVVTGSDYRGLGIVRSLGRRGIPVWVLKHGGQVLGAASRYASRGVSCPPVEDDRQSLDFLLDLAVKERLTGWSLFPTTDESVVLIARHHQQLAEYYRLTTPPWDLVRWACDKRLLYRLADDLGLACPWTFCPRDREELAALNCSSPLILKPAMRMGFNQLIRDKAWRVDDRASLLARYDEARRFMPPEMLMVQELLPGWGEAQFSYAALCKNGTALASIVARRTRQFPMDFGRFSTYVETIEEPGIVEPAVRLLAAMRFTGLIEVEFKQDARDGGFKVLDLNPRVWGWHTLCGRAGVDFPYLAWLQARGETVPEAHGRSGMRWIRMGADLATAIQEIGSGRLSLNSYLRSLGGTLECAMFAWDDPLPGLIAVPALAVMLAKRLLQPKNPATRQPVKDREAVGLNGELQRALRRSRLQP